jgi:osmotically-inducible protein OsmY
LTHGIEDAAADRTMNSPKTRAVLSVLVFGGPMLCGCQRGSTSLPSTTAAAPTAAGSGAAVASAQLRDDDIAGAVQRTIAEDVPLRGQTVQVRVTDGIANLSGNVTTLVAKERASAVAGTIRGVRSVVNAVVVDPPARTDEQLKADVTHALHADLATKTSAIGAAVVNGIVTLTGTTDSWPEQKLIGDVAKAVPGVRGVTNQVAVHSATVRPEGEIAAEVKQRLTNDVWLDGDPLTVTAKGPKVTITGVVGAFQQKVQASADAWVAGVESVDDSGVLVDWAAHDKQRFIDDHPLRSDAEVAQAVRDAFKYDARLTPLEPKVAVHDGTVSLTGSVASSSARRAAEADARNTVGVWQVHDDVLVQPNTTPTDADIDRAAARVMKDDPFLLDGDSIHVSTSKGKTALSGTVESGVERFDAILDAASIPGVVEVDDELTVHRTPAEIQSGIADRLSWDAMVPRDAVHVAVGPDGVATLTGTLASWSEIKAAATDATDGGASRVVNLLKLEGHPEVVVR